MVEPPWVRNARLVVGGLLVVEAFAMSVLATFVAIIGGVAGLLAVGAGAGGATDRQLAQGVGIIALTIASPFVVSAALAVGGLLLLVCRGRGIVIGVGVFALVAQVLFHPFFRAEFHPAELGPAALHVLVVGLALTLVPAAAWRARPV